MKAVALVTESVIKSAIKPLLEDECDRAGVEIQWHCVTHSCAEYSKLFRGHKNVIAWNCRMPHKWMAQWNSNVLYIENSLLCQRSGIFIDRGGFFSNSNLCRKRTWELRHEVEVGEFVKTHFKWDAFSGGNASGPILVALQNRLDCNLNMEFPAAAGAADKVMATLDLLMLHMPAGREVIIRPHPRFIDGWNALKSTYHLRPEWRVEWEESFYSLLPKCSALITVNSTCASEAVTLGIPVATLGTGGFTGSGATFECADDPSRLASLLDWKPDTEKCRRYSEAVLGRHFMSYSHPDASNPELQSWLKGAF